MKGSTRMNKYADTLRPCSARAQCSAIASYKLIDDESIADRIKRDHCSADGHQRAATLIVAAGCAQEIGAKNGYYGKFVFEDGSSF